MCCVCVQCTQCTAVIQFEIAHSSQLILYTVSHIESTHKSLNSQEDEKKKRKKRRHGRRLNQKVVAKFGTRKYQAFISLCVAMFPLYDVRCTMYVHFFSYSTRYAVKSINWPSPLFSFAVIFSHLKRFIVHVDCCSDGINTDDNVEFTLHEPKIRHEIDEQQQKMAVRTIYTNTGKIANGYQWWSDDNAI